MQHLNGFFLTQILLPFSTSKSLSLKVYLLKQMLIGQNAE